MSERAVRYRPFEGPVLIILDEKHGYRHFFAETEAELHAHALAILTERFEGGYHYFEPRQDDPPPPHPISPEVLDQLPPHMRDEHENAVANYERHIKSLEIERTWWKRLVAAVEHKDGFLALRILVSRTDHQYEHIEIKKMTERPPMIPKPHPDAEKHNGQVWCDGDGNRWVYDEDGDRWIPHKYADLEHNVAEHEGRLDAPLSGVKRDPVRYP